jgi:hypothetical protein
MNTPITDQFILSEARDVLLLLEDGKDDEAWQKIKAVDTQLKNDSQKLDPDVAALWMQVGIAASKPAYPRYFEDVKDELNRVIFGYLDEDRKRAA